MVERVSGKTQSDEDGDARLARPAPIEKSRRASSSPKARAQPASKYTKKTIALVYDFDGTLSPKPMQEYAFLPKLGVKAEDFWAECTRVAKAERADPLITYMHLMYKKAKEKGLRVDRKDLVAQGRDVELYQGVENWFGEIERYVKALPGANGVTVKHYLVSSGLTEIIEGTKIYKHFANVFASEYWFDAYDLPFPKRVITDTGKTQYLFRINKGIEDLGESINSHMDEDARPIPFANMIYFGDGETDVPSMALLKKNGGHAIAVHTPTRAPAGSTKDVRSAPMQKCVELFNAGRCDFYAPADYRKGSDLFKRTCLLIDRMVADIRVQEERSGLG
ncbi:MAG: haloacid dehalogenase-like hydrolase [Hyphomicrobium sp.]|nr:haloacid dehalogenase-like hydrolase [Hyphomicrobium sp.]